MSTQPGLQKVETLLEKLFGSRESEKSGVGAPINISTSSNGTTSVPSEQLAAIARKRFAEMHPREVNEDSDAA